MQNARNVRLHFNSIVEKLAMDTGVQGEDIEYVKRRFNSEGLRFLTFTLPSLSKAVISSLEIGVFERPTTFAWKGKSLFFMNSFLSKIFSPTGTVRPDACPLAIKNLRQFCEYFYKLALDSSDDDKAEAEQEYVETELFVRQFKASESWTEVLRKNFETYYPTYCRTPVSQVFNNYRPRFGSGSFSNKVTVNQSLYKKLDDSQIGTCTYNQKAFSGYFKSYPSAKTKISLVDEDKISRVTFVAKDARGPRVISMEPMHLLRSQLSHLDWAIESLQKDTSGRIQFLDQDKNKQLAKIASQDRRNATLDLRSASDRVSYSLMSKILRNSVAARWFLQNVRSTHTLLPSGRLIELAKVAGMGSGLTFPIMSLLIHLSICSQVSVRTGKPYHQVMRSVYVYGDDVIVPTSWYNFAITALTQSGLLVNKEKSFFKGFFRESCGGDYFKGVSVTPVRFKLDKVDLKSASSYKKFLLLNDDRQLYKLDRHARECYKHGLRTLAGYYSDVLRASLFYHYPIVTGDSPLIGEYSEDIIITDDIPVKAFTLSPVIDKSDRCDPYKHLSTSLSKNENHYVFSIKDYIKTRSLAFGEFVRPRAMKLVLRLHPGTKTY